MVCGAVLGVALRLAGMRGCVDAVLSALQTCAVLLTLEGRPSLGLEGALGSQLPPPPSPGRAANVHFSLLSQI